MVAITPAQEALLKFVQDQSAGVLKKSLEHVKDVVLYISNIDLEDQDRKACYTVNEFEKVLRKVARESKLIRS